MAVGAATTAVIAFAAPIAVAYGGLALWTYGGMSATAAVGYSTAAGSAVLTGAAVYGLGMTAVNTYDNVRAENWNAVAYDAGALAGGFAVGAYASLTAPRAPALKELPNFSEESWSNTKLGDEMNAKFPDEFTGQMGTARSSWKFNTKPGQTGLDAVLTDGEVTPGMDAAELKPFTQGSLKGFKTQMNKWYGKGTVEDGDVVQLWGYDQQGKIMSSGRNYSFGDNGLTWSPAPGYGTNGVPTLTPSLLWGAAPGAFSSTSNSSSNQGQSRRGCD